MRDRRKPKMPIEAALAIVDADLPYGAYCAMLEEVYGADPYDALAAMPSSVPTTPKKKPTVTRRGRGKR